MTNALSARAECRWNACATSSLPVPLSPWISIVVRLGAAREIRSKTGAHLRAAADDLVEPVVVGSQRVRSSRFSLASRRRSIAFRSTTSTSSFLKGLVK